MKIQMVNRLKPQKFWQEPPAGILTPSNFQKKNHGNDTRSSGIEQSKSHPYQFGDAAWHSGSGRDDGAPASSLSADMFYLKHSGLAADLDGCMHTDRPLDFSSFPSLLLIAKQFCDLD